MYEITDKQFQKLVDEAITGLPPVHRDNLRNVGFFVRQKPSQKQLEKSGVRKNGLLLGLYEGVPLPQRHGSTSGLPDKITLFKEPLLAISPDMHQLVANIRHTVWHEVAHYFGLDHDMINEIERSW